MSRDSLERRHYAVLNTGPSVKFVTVDEDGDDDDDEKLLFSNLVTGTSRVLQNAKVAMTRLKIISIDFLHH